MDLSLFDKIKTFLTLPFQSFLTVEILLIFIIIYIFLLYNEKRDNKIVKYSLVGLIIFFFSLLTFYFSNDLFFVLSYIIKTIMKCFYFPNLIFYLITAISSLVILIYTILNKNSTKLNKFITYTLSLGHIYLFVNFIARAISENISLVVSANIYQYNDMFIIIFVSQLIFIILIIYKIVYYLHYNSLKIEKKKI